MNVTDTLLAVSGLLGGNGSRGEGGGMTPAVRTALRNLMEHVAYTDEHGQEYYDALVAALNGGSTPDLESISAVFNQGSAVIYETDSLDTLRQYLTITANYSDTTTKAVTDYTLSGTLVDGTSVITASYGGKTDTFSVTVSKAPTQTVEMERLFKVQSSSVSPYSTVYSDGGDTMLKSGVTVAFASVETFSVDTVVEITITYGMANANLKQYAASWDGSGAGIESSPYIGNFGEVIGNAQTTAYTATYTVKAGNRLLIKNYNGGVWQSLTVTK